MVLIKKLFFSVKIELKILSNCDLCYFSQLIFICINHHKEKTTKNISMYIFLIHCNIKINMESIRQSGITLIHIALQLSHFDLQASIYEKWFIGFLFFYVLILISK